MSDEKLCISFNYSDRCCGLSYDEDELDEYGYPEGCPSSCDPETDICLDDGEDKGCDEYCYFPPDEV